MSDINVTVLNAAESGERAVTTGTKAWELFADDPQVVAARIGGELRDLAHELADCLWSVLTLADAYDVDLAAAFTSTMDELDEVLAED